MLGHRCGQRCNV